MVAESVASGLVWQALAFLDESSRRERDRIVCSAGLNLSRTSIGIDKVIESVRLEE